MDQTRNATNLAVYELPGPTNLTSQAESALLFCHAAGFLGQVWSAVARRMCIEVPRFAVDFRGHGSSPPLPHDAGWEAFRDDVLDARRRIEGRNVVGIGHSLGATALLLAAAHTAEAFDAVICFEPILAELDNPAIAQAAARRRAHFPSRLEATRAFTARGPLTGLAPEVMAAYVSTGLADSEDGIALRCSPTTEAHVYATAIRVQWQEALPRVTCPAVFLVGADSNLVRRDSVLAAAATMPYARVDSVAEMGHLGPLERPATLAAVFDALLMKGPTAIQFAGSEHG